jgi:tetratricopeptide (TPR) repeat protein
MSIKVSGRSGFLRTIHLASLLTSLVTLTLLAYSADAASSCKLAPLGEFPVNMQGPRPIVAAKINGTPVNFIFDSGAFYSLMSSASASQLQLNLSAAPRGFYLTGVGGRTDPTVAVLKLLEVGSFVVHNVQFLVGGTDMGAEAVGVLGQNLFRIGDIEYDLGKGEIHLWHSADCENTPLAYWAKPGEAYSMITIAGTTGMQPHTEGSAYVNGAQISVMFDSGAGSSILSLKSAERSGVTPESPGVVEGGYTYGIGRGLVKTYIGTFSSFKIGDEEIHNAKLRFGDLGQGSVGMLLGADFFLSHRIYVASNARQLYFTYNGGRVFNLSKSSAKADAAPPPTAPSNAATSADAASPAPSAAAKTSDDSPGAAELGRRGAASVSRRDYESALADLTRAAELDPANTENFYQLGLVHLQTGKRDAAAGDFNHVLELKPDHIPALMWRAQMRITERNIPSARIDLDAVDQGAAKEASVRFELARAYGSVDLFDSALKQWDLWISYHENDPRMGTALNGRCWDRASLGLDLAAALKDCDSAIRLSTEEAKWGALDSRAFVYFRLNEYAKAIADYDASLKLRPKNAWSLYGRGIAKLRENKTAEGHADVSQAVAIAPNIAEQFKKRGIAP